MQALDLRSFTILFKNGAMAEISVSSSEKTADLQYKSKAKRGPGVNPDPFTPSRTPSQLKQCALHSGGSLIAHTRHFMEIPIEGKGNAGVPKKFLYQLGVVPTAQ